jgi:hypothetical protein
VCQLWSRRRSDEPDPYEQGYDTSPQRAPHRQQLMGVAHSCHAPRSQTRAVKTAGHRRARAGIRTAGIPSQSNLDGVPY